MKIRSAKDIGLIIRENRRQRGWDQQALADHVGVSRLWVSQMENGKRSVQLDLVLRALAVLEIDLHAGNPPMLMERGVGKSASAANILQMLRKT